MKALFLARLQPLHLGHLHAIKQAMKKFDKVVIAIGSSNKQNTLENPFSFEEREEMIRMCFGEFGIVGLEDKESDEEWCEELMKKANFDVVISGSEWVRECISNVKKVIPPELLIPEIYNGTNIREKMARGEKWEDLVPEKVARYIKKIRGEERLKRLRSQASIE